ncbi:MULTISPECIES: hypothetical protein [unclassified Bradyrhizobium]|nr:MULTISPECIES: hypothetical protein [unclassified Bradyrhizobium]
MALMGYFDESAADARANAKPINVNHRTVILPFKAGEYNSAQEARR